MGGGLIKKFKDKQLLSRLRSRDKEAFVKVYDEHVADIHRFVYFKIGRRDEADDLTSIIFLKAWNHIQNKTLEDAKTLRALLYKIARNAIVDYFRDQSRPGAISLDDEDNPVDVAADQADPGMQMDEAREMEQIRQKLPLLKEEYREMIIMRFINDLSLDEIAEITGKNKGAVRVSLHRALNALRELVGPAEEL